MSKYAVGAVGISTNSNHGNNKNGCTLSMGVVDANNKDEAVGCFLPEVLKRFTIDGKIFSTVGVCKIEDAPEDQEETSKLTDNTDMPKLPELEEVLEHFGVNHELWSDGQRLTHSYVKDVYNFIAGKIGMS